VLVPSCGLLDFIHDGGRRVDEKVLDRSSAEVGERLRIGRSICKAHEQTNGLHRISERLSHLIVSPVQLPCCEALLPVPPEHQDIAAPVGLGEVRVRHAPWSHCPCPTPANIAGYVSPVRSVSLAGGNPDAVIVVTEPATRVTPPGLRRSLFGGFLDAAGSPARYGSVQGIAAARDTGHIPH